MRAVREFLPGHGGDNADAFTAMVQLGDAQLIVGTKAGNVWIFNASYGVAPAPLFGEPLTVQHGVSAIVAQRKDVAVSLTQMGKGAGGDMGKSRGNLLLRQGSALQMPSDGSGVPVEEKDDKAAAAAALPGIEMSPLMAGAMKGAMAAAHSAAAGVRSTGHAGDLVDATFIYIGTETGELFRYVPNQVRLQHNPIVLFGAIQSSC